MPRTDVDTRRELEHIQGLVRQLLSRYIQGSALVDEKVFFWQVEALQRRCPE